MSVSGPRMPWNKTAASAVLREQTDDRELMRMTEITGLEPPPALPTGCIVVLEPGAKWPSEAFAKVPDRDGVAVVRLAADDEPERFSDRLARQFEKLKSGGVLIRSVLVACAMSSAMQPMDRTTLARYIQRNMRNNTTASVTFVTAEDEEL